MSSHPQRPATRGTAPPQSWVPGGGAPQRPPRPPRTGLRRFLPTWRTVLGGLLLFLLILTGGFIAGYTLVDIPPANATAVKQSNVYLYADGSPLARDGEVNRESVPLTQVPRTVQQAVLSAEDRDFYSESAIDPQAMVRAAWNTLTGKGRQSGSTITQQYVKNYYLAQEQTLTRKAKEFFIAIKLDREKSKDEILTGYLNTSYFGRNAYGIQAAAQAYYGKDSDELTTAEGAYLAALLNAPSAYDVSAHPDNRARAEARWNYVLDGMVKEGWLVQADRAALEFPVPGRSKAPAGMSGQRGYLVEAVNTYLSGSGAIDEDTLQAGGYRITTTLHKGKQKAMAEAVQDQLMSKLRDSRKVDTYVRAGGASIDPDTGKVVAMYGGIDYTKQYVNNATRRDYQVGSTFKPFVFTSAVENGSTTQDGRRITPNTVYDGSNKREVQGRNGPTGYRPANEDDADYGDITVAEATDRSVNSVYAQMGEDVGQGLVKETATDLGVPKDAPGLAEARQSVALGVVNASVLDMTKAYATLANHGEHGTYSLVEKVTKGGQDVSLPDRDPKPAVSREAADTTTSILRSVVASGTGTAAQSAGRPAAGKTGTAEEDRAAWFAGYTPDLATVIAVMGQDPDSGEQKPLYGATGLPRINGGGYPAQIWGQYTAAALRSSPAESFDLELQEGAESTSPPSSESPSGDPSGSGSASPPSGSASPSGTPSSAPPTSGSPTSPTTAPPTSPTDVPSSPITTQDEDEFFPDGM
ncbi:transglycosylase domain-containing protein [Streptomyces sp. 8N616]|uniref:transglycosylase domain-containing protein n=1 Tax=Streptomyces sp. 8N616 TaxID=3457414 RepID=UPI003FD5391E